MSKSKAYFEGWYYKIVTNNFDSQFAIIPGISLNADDSHSFIQVFDGVNNLNHYFRYEIDDFDYDKKNFVIKIKDNYFSKDEMIIDIPDVIQGHINFTNHISYPKKFYKPNIMGPFSFIPMECNHHLYTLQAKTYGTINYKGQEINFDKGMHYLEKDYGDRFPNIWTWHLSQSADDKSTLFFAIADIPLGPIMFKGIICCLNVGHDKYEFTTYNLSRLTQYDNQDKELHVEFKSFKWTLQVKVAKEKGVKLPAPTNKGMTGYVEETMQSKTWVKLINNRTKKVEYEKYYKVSSLELGFTK